MPGHGLRGRGARLESDLATYREVWGGAPVGNGPNPAVPSGTRQVPMLFGGYSTATLNCTVRWGEGYIGGSLPVAMTAPGVEAAKRAWQARTTNSASSYTRHPYTKRHIAIVELELELDDHTEVKPDREKGRGRPPCLNAASAPPFERKGGAPCRSWVPYGTQGVHFIVPA
ncbi:hypothetical protein ACH4YO_39345 [Streptomyces noursei]|uniref:hypothetical protein n=1 Tax=Streptomyces noursei TaxID=1971 RepID=UPI0033F91867